MIRIVASVPTTVSRCAERNADYFDRMGFDVDEHAAISRRNAVRLMPRLAKLVAP